MTPGPALRLGLPSVLAVLVTAGCAGAPLGGSRGSDGAEGTTGEITVFAAASLQRPFTQIGADVERAHPGVSVRFNFAGSSDLAAQLRQGAPADVFASADTRNMDKVTADALTTATPVDFATNVLEIAVPPGNPGRVHRLSDLARAGLKVVVCAPAVPCGAAARTVEDAAGVDIAPVSEEQSVTDVLGKVIAGEADAGLVYVTDVKGAAGAVEGVTFPESSAAVNTYPIVALEASGNPSLARLFLDAVTGTAGQDVLTAAGFGPKP